VSGKVSLIVWHDVEDDPDPTEHGDWSRRIIGLTDSGVIWTETAEDFAMIGAAGDGAERDIVAWAELPTPSEATVDDLSIVMGGFLCAAEASEKRRGIPAGALREPSDRLRALLPKEGTDS